MDQVDEVDESAGKPSHSKAPWEEIEFWVIVTALGVVAIWSAVRMDLVEGRAEKLEKRCEALERIVGSTARPEEAMKGVSDLGDKVKAEQEKIIDLQKGLRDLEYGGN